MISCSINIKCRGKTIEGFASSRFHIIILYNNIYYTFIQTISELKGAHQSLIFIDRIIIGSRIIIHVTDPRTFIMDTLYIMAYALRHRISLQCVQSLLFDCCRYNMHKHLIILYVYAPVVYIILY